MEWLDRGYVLSVRLHGESALIVSILTEANGRHPGLVRGEVLLRRGCISPEIAWVNWRADLQITWVLIAVINTSPFGRFFGHAEQTARPLFGGHFT